MKNNEVSFHFKGKQHLLAKRKVEVSCKKQNCGKLGYTMMSLTGSQGFAEETGGVTSKCDFLQHLEILWNLVSWYFQMTSASGYQLTCG